MTVLSFLAAVLAVAFSTAMPLARENISFTAVSAPAAGDRTTVYGIPADPSGCHRIPFMYITDYFIDKTYLWAK
jgi:hypothetical protein